MVLGIRYLTGYCVARDLTLQQPEWPPHPARIFMAMAAAHFEGGVEPAERQALLWLEDQPPPRIFASPAQNRSLVEAYVPVNDQHGGIVKRVRQSRTFPTTRPHQDLVYLFWTEQPSATVLDALAGLCAKVTRIGHSSSLTQMWVLDTLPSVEPNWEPNDFKSSLSVRVPEKGFLQSLETSFNGRAVEEYLRLLAEMAVARGKTKTALKNQIEERFGPDGPRSSRPVVNTWRGYLDVTSLKPKRESPPITGPFDPDFIVLTKFDGRNLGLESTLQLTLALRNAFLKALPEPQPEWFSGHAPDGTPSKHPHLAFFPLPYVSAKHADGHVMGLGVAIPRTLAGESRPLQQALRQCIGPLFFGRDGKLKNKIKLWKSAKSDGRRAWEWELHRDVREDPPVSLRTITWTGPSNCWASVTPVVLHHYPKKDDSEDVVRIVREAFASALFPLPESVEISFTSAHTGAGSFRGLPAFAERNGVPKYYTHVVARFAHKVTGPMLVGLGRFRGYGLFRPCHKTETTRE